eukprot:PhF_6_TR28260/c0_g1_i2/m.41810
MSALTSRLIALNNDVTLTHTARRIQYYPLLLRRSAETIRTSPVHALHDLTGALTLMNIFQNPPHNVVDTAPFPIQDFLPHLEFLKQNGCWDILDRTCSALQSMTHAYRNSPDVIDSWVKVAEEGLKGNGPGSLGFRPPEWDALKAKESSRSCPSFSKAVPFLVQPIQGKGLGIVAAKDISPGQTVWSEYPITFVSSKPNICAYCGKDTDKSTTTPAKLSCSRNHLTYCSESCKNDSWLFHHQYECENELMFGNNVKAPEGNSDSTKLVTRMVMSRDIGRTLFSDTSPYTKMTFSNCVFDYSFTNNMYEWLLKCGGDPFALSVENLSRALLLVHSNTFSVHGLVNPNDP